MEEELTKRELEVLELIADGNTDEVISRKLHISKDTANSHRKKILLKMEARNVAVLIRKAMRKRLIK